MPAEPLAKSPAAQRHRLLFVADILDGFTDGIEYERLFAGLFWAREGRVSESDRLHLEGLFAAPHQAALDEGEGGGDPMHAARADLDRVGVQALEAACAAEDRSTRQRRVHAWCAAAFGLEHATAPQQRAVRFLEEAVELYQALGADRAMAHRLVDFVFARPPGDNADEAEAREIQRILAKPLAYFQARNQSKNAAGFNTLGTPQP